MKPFKFSIQISPAAQAKITQEKRDAELAAQQRDQEDQQDQQQERKEHGQQQHQQQEEEERKEHEQHEDSHNQFKRQRTEAFSGIHSQHEQNENDDDSSAIPLLPSSTTAIQSTNTNIIPNNTNDNNDDANSQPNLTKRSFAQVAWDDDDDYSTSDDEDQSNPPLHPSHLAHQQQQAQQQQKQQQQQQQSNQFLNVQQAQPTSFPSMYRFDYAIRLGVQSTTTISAITTTILDHQIDTNQQQSYVYNRFNSELQGVDYNTFDYNSKCEQIISNPNYFDGILLHCGSADGTLTTIDFSLRLFKIPLVTTLPKAQAITKLLPIQYFNPNPQLYQYERNSGVVQHKKPIHLIALTTTNQFHALTQSHQLVGLSKQGFPARLAEKEPGHIGPIRDIAFSPSLLSYPIHSSTISPLSALHSQFGLQRHQLLNIQPQTQNLIYREQAKWNQTFTQHFHRTTLITGGEDSLLRVWDLTIPKGQTLEGHMQYWFEKGNTTAFKLNTHSLSSPGVGCDLHQLKMKLNYIFHPSTKVIVTTVCQVTQSFVLVGTRGGLIFGVDLTKNVKESIWVINPTQYLPIPSVESLPMSQSINAIEIRYDETLEVKQFLMISPHQVLVVVSGPLSCCFILNVSNNEFRHHTQYYNETTVFYHQELEITSVLPTYSNNLPHSYHKSKVGTSDLSNTNSNLLPNWDGLLTGLVLGANINKDIKTAYYRVEKDLQTRHEGLINSIATCLEQIESEKTNAILEENQYPDPIIKQHSVKQELIQELIDGVVVKIENDEQSANSTNNTTTNSTFPPPHQSAIPQAWVEKIKPQGSAVNNDGDDNNSGVYDDEDDYKVNKVYTMDQLATLDIHDAVVAEENRKTSFDFPSVIEVICEEYSSAQRRKFQLINQSRPGVDFQPQLPLLQPTESLLDHLIMSVRLEHYLQLKNEEEYYHKLEPSLVTKSSFDSFTQAILPNFSPPLLYQHHNNTTSTLQSSSNQQIMNHNSYGTLHQDSGFIIPISFNLPSQNYSAILTETQILPPTTLVPSIELISHISQPINCLTWFKSMLVIGSDRSVIFLPNTALIESDTNKTRLTSQIFSQLISSQSQMLKHSLNTTIVQDRPKPHRNGVKNNKGMKREGDDDTIKTLFRQK